MIYTLAYSHYGYWIAQFKPTVINAWGRDVMMTAIIWDHEYGMFRGHGHYMKKDGTAGNQIAKPLMLRSDVPKDLYEAFMVELAK